jgi:hypothetical protein
VEVLQNIQLLELSKEELLEVASRFQGMDRVPIEKMGEVLRMLKFGCVPLAIMGDSCRPPEELREFVIGNFLASLRLGHKPLRDALALKPEARSADQADVTTSIAFGKIESAFDVRYVYGDKTQLSVPSISQAASVIFSDKITPGFTLSDIKAGVERRKGMVKKQNPIIEAIDKTIVELSKVKDLVH